MRNNLVEPVSVRLNFTRFGILTAWSCTDTRVAEFSEVLQEVQGITEMIYWTCKPSLLGRKARGREGIVVEWWKKMLDNLFSVINNSSLIDNYI